MALCKPGTNTELFQNLSILQEFSKRHNFKTSQLEYWNSSTINMLTFQNK